jgi:hypothetical protein
MTTSKQMGDDLQKMEDDLKIFFLNGRRPKKKWKITFNKREDDLKKMEDDLNKWKTTSKNNGWRPKK